MSGTASGPLWLIVIGPIAGALVGFLSASLIDLWRNRRHVKIEQSGGLCFFATRGTTNTDMVKPPVPGHIYDQRSAKSDVSVWVRCDPDDNGSVLHLFVDLTVANLSFLDDAVTDLYLVLGPRDGVPRDYARFGNQQFRGVNVRAHSIVPLTLRFKFDKESFEQFPHWRFDRTTKYALVARTIRGQKLILQIEPAAWIMAGSRGDFVSRRVFEPPSPLSVDAAE